MWEQIFQAFLMQGILPEVLRAIEEHFNSTGQLLTLPELQAKMKARSEAIIDNGTDWLSTHQ